MIPAAKMSKLLNDLKSYKKKFVNDKYSDLDESATRIMVNEMLSIVLGYAPIDEIKTEYMIRGTYADYVVQFDNKRHFLVEVKGMNISLSDKHLRQAINYAANEGIEWALLTNGKEYNLYKVIFGQPIDSKLVFSIDMEDLKLAADCLQYLHKASVQKKGLELLWNKVSALDPQKVAGLLYHNQIIGIIKRELKKKYNISFAEEDIMLSINRIIGESIEDVKPIKEKKVIKKRTNNSDSGIQSEPESSEVKEEETNI
jgi:hypothetical protein